MLWSFIGMESLRNTALLRVDFASLFSSTAHTLQV
jgi:hypothetical protein